MSRCTCIYFEIVTFIPRNCISLRNIILHIVSIFRWYSNTYRSQ